MATTFRRLCAPYIRRRSALVKNAAGIGSARAQRAILADVDHLQKKSRR
jgi:hypothetical protein